MEWVTIQGKCRMDVPPCIVFTSLALEDLHPAHHRKDFLLCWASRLSLFPFFMMKKNYASNFAFRHSPPNLSGQFGQPLSNYK